MFSTRLEIFLPFLSNLKLPSANSFSLEQSKTLSFWKGFIMKFTNSNKLNRFFKIRKKRWNEQLHISIVNRTFQLFTTQSRLLTTLRKGVPKSFWEREKMLVTSIFSFSHIVFYPFYPLRHKFQFWVTFILSSANAFNLDQSKTLLFDKELKTCVSHVFISLRINKRGYIHVYQPLHC